MKLFMAQGDRYENPNRIGVSNVLQKVHELFPEAQSLFDDLVEQSQLDYIEMFSSAERKGQPVSIRMQQHILGDLRNKSNGKALIVPHTEGNAIVVILEHWLNFYSKFDFDLDMRVRIERIYEELGYEWCFTKGHVLPVWDRYFE